jgi:hypothetical protein
MGMHYSADVVCEPREPLRSVTPSRLRCADFRHLTPSRLSRAVVPPDFRHLTPSLAPRFAVVPPDFRHLTPSLAPRFAIAPPDFWHLTPSLAPLFAIAPLLTSGEGQAGRKRDCPEDVRSWRQVRCGPSPEVRRGVLACRGTSAGVRCWVCAGVRCREVRCRDGAGVRCREVRCRDGAGVRCRDVRCCGGTRVGCCVPARVRCQS